MNEEPQGANNSGGATATLETQPPVVANANNILEQAGAVVAQAETNGPIVDAPKDVLTQATEVVAEAEATGGKLPNPIDPFANPDTTQKAGEIHSQMISDKSAAASAPKSEPWYKRLNPFQTSYENPNAKKEGKMPEAKVESPGLGLAPAVTKVEPVTPLPEGANPVLATGSTGPVPGVPAEAQTAEANSNKILGGNENLPDTPTSTPTTDTLDRAVDEMHQTAESAWKATEPDTAKEADVTTMGNQPEAPASEIPAVPTAVEAPATEPTVNQITPAPPQPEAAVDAHTDIVEHDKDEAAKAGDAEDAANKAMNEGPNLDPLGGVPTFNATDATQAESTTSNLPEVAKTEETPAANDILNVTPTINTEASAATETPSTETTVSETESLTPPYTAEPPTTAEQPSPSPLANGDTAIESVATPLPGAAQNDENQWSASNFAGSTQENAQGSSSAVEPSAESTLPSSQPTEPTQELPSASEGLPGVTTDETTETPATPITPASPDATLGVQPQEQIASAQSGGGINVVPSEPVQNDEIPGITTADSNAQTANVTPISPDVTPGVQTQEQIAAAQSGGGLNVASSESTPDSTQAPTADNAPTPIRPDVNIPGVPATPIEEPEEKPLAA